jgi:hypothetical protein
MYETGFGVKKDMNEAKSWVTKAAHQGHETAKFKLLYWDIEKNGVTKKNKAEVDVLVAKAEDGNPQAQFYVGKMHANGVGVKKNSDVAIGWLNKAALVGVLAAENELITVREAQQHQALAREKSRSRADEKNRAELKVKQEQEKQAQLEKQRKSQAKIKARNNDIAKKNKAAADARLAAEKKAEQQAKIVAQAEATARKREAQKQALLKKRTADEKKNVPLTRKNVKFNLSLIPAAVSQPGFYLPVDNMYKI